MRQRSRVLGVILAALLTSCWPGGSAQACTAAVVSPNAAADGRPFLWKNRDTDCLSNKLLYVREQPHAYLALVDTLDASGRKCFAGLNDAGFAIINTVAYNLPAEPGEVEDLEGMIMADALRTCATVAEFETLLRSRLGPELGSLSNFGVLDASGATALFELHNHGLERIDTAGVPGRYLVVTNYARSGLPGAGHGYLRFDRACRLFAEQPAGGIDFRVVLTRFSRDIEHALLQHPPRATWHELPADRDHWIDSRDCIDRPSTAATVVIVGRDPTRPASRATLWLIPGEPLCAIALPIWVEAGRSPAPLWQGLEAPLWHESLRLKSLLRPYPDGHMQDYLNLVRLDNAEGTGWLPHLLEVESAIQEETERFLTRKQLKPQDLARFQDNMSQRALQTLQALP
jgi:hypothetical protein